MLRPRYLLLSAAMLMLICGSASAADNWSVYWAAGGGLLLPKGANHQTGLNVAGRVGLHNARFPGFALEADAGDTLVSGNYHGSDLELATLGGYLVWRSNGRWYLKLRAGGLWESVRVGDGSATDSGLSGGIGGGHRFANGRALELEFTVIEKNINMLSLSWQF